MPHILPWFFQPTSQCVCIVRSSKAPKDHQKHIKEKNRACQSSSADRETGEMFLFVGYVPCSLILLYQMLPRAKGTFTIRSKITLHQSHTDQMSRHRWIFLKWERNPFCFHCLERQSRFHFWRMRSVFNYYLFLNNWLCVLLFWQNISRAARTTEHLHPEQTPW